MAESLQFSIGADTKSFNDGIAGMVAGLAGLVAAFIGVQKVVEAFSEAIDMGGRLHDLSTRTGETAGNLAILERAFENTSVGAEKLGPAIAKMQKSMVDMAQGSDEAVAAFKQLGLSWADLEGKSPAEQMQLIGERLAAIYDPAVRAETAIRIFGKSGADLIPILTNFASETAQAREQLGSLPDQLDRTADSVDTLGDNLSAIRNKLTEMAYGFLSEVVPAVNAFTNKLAGIDAAGLGAQLADSLVGAFAMPYKAAESMGDILVLGVKSMGNEFVYQVRYWTEALFNTFSILGDDIIPMIGNNLAGTFAMAVGTLGNGLAEVLRPMADAFGLDFVNDLKTGAEELMVSGAAKITESANAFQSAMAEAQKNSTVIREDFFGVEGSSAKIQQDWAEIQKSGKQLVDDLASAELSPTAFAESRTTSGDAVDPLISLLINENLVNQQPTATATATVKAKTAAQIQAELNKQLGLIAAAGSTQLIGQSAAARTAIEDQKKLEQMIALGKGDTAEAKTLQSSIQRHIDMAAGINLTSADQYAASSWAWTEYLKEGQTKSLDELTNLAEQNIMERKRSADQLTKAEQAEKAKAEAAGAGGAAGAKGAPPVSLASIVNSIQMILQKIEPKIPTHVMA